MLGNLYTYFKAGQSDGCNPRTGLSCFNEANLAQTMVYTPPSKGVIHTPCPFHPSLPKPLEKTEQGFHHWTNHQTSPSDDQKPYSFLMSDEAHFLSTLNIDITNLSWQIGGHSNSFLLNFVIQIWFDIVASHLQYLLWICSPFSHTPHYLFFHIYLAPFFWCNAFVTIFIYLILSKRVSLQSSIFRLWQIDFVSRANPGNCFSFCSLLRGSYSSAQLNK